MTNPKSSKLLPILGNQLTLQWVLSVGQNFDQLARSAPRRRSHSSSRARRGSIAVRDELGGTSGISDSRSWSAGSTNPQVEGGEVVNRRWQIFFPRLKPFKVSLPVFIAYWGSLVIAILGVGLTWGF